MHSDTIDKLTEQERKLLELAEAVENGSIEKTTIIISILQDIRKVALEALRENELAVLEKVKEIISHEALKTLHQKVPGFLKSVIK